MPSIRNTHGLIACTRYTLRVCDDEPCEYHMAVDEAKQRGITLDMLMHYRSIQSGERDEENPAD